jgi:hypothetical protein
LRSGVGAARAGDKAVEFSFQQPVSLPAQTTITLENAWHLPLVLRVYLLEGK